VRNDEGREILLGASHVLARLSGWGLPHRFSSDLLKLFHFLRFAATLCKGRNRRRNAPSETYLKRIAAPGASCGGLLHRGLKQGDTLGVRVVAGSNPAAPTNL
jgi:hypothetical protein